MHTAPPKIEGHKINWEPWCNQLPPFDIGVVVSFGRMIPSMLLQRFPLVTRG